ncbi:MAG: OmpA family protein [Flavobacterium sp.]|nr:OmpA family protein [Flavobacterium sp.]
MVIAQERFSVYFDTNKFEVSKKEESRLKDWIKANKNSKIVAINGYTDEVGSSGFNDTLAQKRVNFIFEYVKDKIKIRADFKTRSFGENFNQSQNKAENRKATIYYILEKDLVNENEILGIKNPIQDIEITDDMPIHQKVQLAKVGTKIILKNINFFQNTFAMTPESNGALYDLLFVMQNNPNLKIQIQGHICCVDTDRKNLSLERAKQVRRFLVFKGILQHRVSVTGKGVSEPLFPIPEANEEQAAANRRVEIEILSK